MNFDATSYNNCSGKMIKVALYVLQVSVATQLLCGGKHDKMFIVIFLLNPKMKDFEKRPTFAEVMN